MIKIKVSYQNKKELDKIIMLIGDNVEKVKLSKNNKGKFKKAYIYLNFPLLFLDNFKIGRAHV